jgi:hypothetical protein
MSEKTVYICDHCESEHDHEIDLIRAHNGDDICQDCIDNGEYDYCDLDGELYPINELVWIECDGVFIHEDNFSERYFYCDHCDEIEKHDHGTMVYNRGYARKWCEACFENSAFYCEHCDNYYHLDHENWNEDDEMSYCDDCFGEVDSNRLVHNYSYKPSPVFFGSASKFNPFIGVEVEVECLEQNAEFCAEHMQEHFGNKLYCKNDSSLDHGVEIVSHPMTMNEHLKLYSNVELCPWLRDNGYRSYNTNTCGIHFHIEKKHMSTAWKVRFGMLFNICQKYFEVLAQRKAARYTRYIKKDSLKAYGYSSDRYEAVNFNNSATVEVRIFRGTLAENTIKAHVELVHAAYNFTYNKHCFSTYPNDRDYFQRFVDFIYSCQIYTSLETYLERKKPRLQDITIPERLEQLAA